MVQKKKIAEIVLAALSVIGALGGFWAVERAIHAPEANAFLTPTLWFSLFFIAFGILSMIALRREILVFTVGAALMSSFFFSFALMHFLTILFAAGLVFLGAWEVRKDRTMSMRVHAGKSVRAGLSLMVFGVSMVIASQYYWDVRGTSFDELFDRAMEKSIFSNVINAAVDNTLEQQNSLIEESARKSVGSVETVLGVRRGVLEGLLGEGGMTGVNNAVRGSLESAAAAVLPSADSLRDMVRDQTKAMIVQQFPRAVTFFAQALAALVFLSALSIGSLMRFIWLPLIQFIFFLLKITGVIEIRTTHRDAEVIA